MKDIEQDSTGQLFCAPYIDDGVFKMKIFTKNYFDQCESGRASHLVDRELNFNDRLQLDNSSMPNQGFDDPYITATFCNNNLCIFVNLFHNSSLTHYHFIYEIESDEMCCIQKYYMGGSEKNFPYKCFFNEDDQMIYSFYRQGQAFMIPTSHESLQKQQVQIKWTSLTKKVNKEEIKIEYQPKAYSVEQMTDKDLGQMYLIGGKALVARSSSQILFFKRELVEDLGCYEWKLYHTLEHRGFIYFIKGNKRIQVTTDYKIFFYLIDPETFMPKLENVMYNFMNCNQMMFGSKVRYCITYKSNEKNFDVYTRKFEHDFKATVVRDNYEGSLGISVETQMQFLVSKVDSISVHDSQTFQELRDHQIDIDLLESDSRERNQIISMTTCHSDEYLAILTGKKLIKNQQKPNQIFIYRRSESDGRFEFLKKIIIAKNPQMQEICMKYYFKIPESGKSVDTIIFAKKDQIIELDFMTEWINVSSTFKELSTQPEFFLLNDDQTAMVVASQQDCIYKNLTINSMHDLDNEYEISNIKEIIYDIEDQSFYLLANKHKEKLGCFMIKFHENHPLEQWQFLMQLKNKLDIADADIFVLRNEKEKYKELIVSYKTIYINTYNISIIDISTTGFNKDIQRVVFRHESFQLWESTVTGFLLNQNKDFVTLSREGIQVTALGSIQQRKVKSKKINVGRHGTDVIKLHSLESINYLKVDTDNCVLFEFAGDNKEISIQQQYSKKSKRSNDQDKDDFDFQTKFDTIYKIKIFQITLRELLLLQSIPSSSTLTDILQLVSDQPNASVFYKSFLEFDLNNMCSILSFDSRSMKVLLDETKNRAYFQEKYPIFYKNKIRKSNNVNNYYYRSAIDNALVNNQISAIEYMIDYIVKYQNNYTSSFMFQKTFIQLMEKGIPVFKLLDSQIFRYKIDFDEWPQTHNDRTYCLKPFHTSVFDLRQKYDSIFPDIGYPESESLKDQQKKSSRKKLYKVEYTVNLLPNVSMYFQKVNGQRIKKNPDQSLMQQCSNTEELEIFKTSTIQEVIEYKWSTFGRKIHLLGCAMHFIYILTITQFVDEIYIKQDIQDKPLYLSIMLLGIIYPLVYDTIQLYKLGYKEYFSEFWNYTDFAFIWLGFLNIVMQYVDIEYIRMIKEKLDLGGDEREKITKAIEEEILIEGGELRLVQQHALNNRVLMIIVILLAIVKTFFYLRIFENLSYIVTMLKNVIYDLRVFLIFYFMMIFLFGLIFGVLGIGNKDAPGDYKNLRDDTPETFYDVPYEEYDHVGMFIGNIIYVMRASIGDFDFGASEYLTRGENFIFWMVWALIVVMLCIIFLNFIISEIGASYEKYKECLDQLISKERATLISEAEDMMFERFTDENNYPRCIIERQVS